MVVFASFFIIPYVYVYIYMYDSILFLIIYVHIHVAFNSHYITSLNIMNVMLYLYIYTYIHTHIYVILGQDQALENMGDAGQQEPIADHMGHNQRYHGNMICTFCEYDVIIYIHIYIHMIMGLFNSQWRYERILDHEH